MVYTDGETILNGWTDVTSTQGIALHCIKTHRYSGVYRCVSFNFNSLFPT